MIIPVHMLAFYEENGIVRDVEIPEDQSNGIYDGKVDQILELVFKYGQNDFQPKDCYSVSVGDVAQVGFEYFICMPIGWKQLSRDEFKKLKAPTSTTARKMFYS